MRKYIIFIGAVLAVVILLGCIFVFAEESTEVTENTDFQTVTAAASGEATEEAGKGSSMAAKIIASAIIVVTVSAGFIVAINKPNE